MLVREDGGPMITERDSKGTGLSPVWVTTPCSRVKYFTLTVPLSVQEFEMGISTPSK